MVPTAPKRLFSEEPINYRNIISRQSSDSQNGSANEWIRPNTNNWTGFPRPASRNVMQIDHGSGMMAVLPESSTPSSDEQKSFSHGHVKQIQVLPFHDKSSRSAPVTISPQLNSNESSSEDYRSIATPPKHDVSPTILTNIINTGSEFR